MLGIRDERLMPKSKNITIYETFDGQEFPDEESAKKHEEFIREQQDYVRKKGIELRKNFLKTREKIDELPPFYSKVLAFVGTFKDNDAWKIMLAMVSASDILYDLIANKEFEELGYGGVAKEWKWLLYDTEDGFPECLRTEISELGGS